MSYGVLQIGKTGPSGRIGSGTGFHIDSKYSRGLDWNSIVNNFDTKATRYAGDGRNIVFSNEGVHGQVYDPGASLEQKIDLLKRANAAHSHSVHDDYYSFDYYAPVGTDVYDKSAEGAPIYIAGASGLKATGDSGGGYGNYAYLTDADGNVVSKVGHGDTNETIFGGGVIGSDSGTSDLPSPTPAATDTTQSTAVEKAKKYQEMSKSELDDVYDSLRKADPAKAAEEGMKMHKAFFNK